MKKKASRLLPLVIKKKLIALHIKSVVVSGGDVENYRCRAAVGRYVTLM